MAPKRVVVAAGLAAVVGAYPAPVRPPTLRRRFAAAGGDAASAAESPLAASSAVEARFVAPEAWVASRDELSEAEAAAAVPLYVLDGPLVPGTSHAVDVRADDAGLCALYDDLLLRGGRTVVTTMGLREEGADGTAKTALALYGCKMTLERVEDATDKSDGRVRWTCDHSLARDRVRVDKVVGRGDEGAATYLSCLYTDAPDARLDVENDATAVVTRGPHAGATGTVESVGNGWIRLRTPDGRVVAARGRDSVDVVRAADAAAAAAPAPAPTKTALGAATDALGAALATLEATGADLRDLLNTLSVGGGREAAPAAAAAAAAAAAPAAPAAERRALDALREVAALQAAGDEDVRFNEAALDLLGAGRGVGVGSLWHLADACWLSYLDSRAAARKKRLHGDLHERLLDFLEASGRLPGDADATRGAATLALSELPADLRALLTSLERRVADDLEPIGAAKAELQRLLDADDHDARCDAFAAVLGKEAARLRARQALRALFGAGDDAAAPDETVPLPRADRGADSDDAGGPPPKPGL